MMPTARASSGVRKTFTVTLAGCLLLLAVVGVLVLRPNWEAVSQLRTCIARDQQELDQGQAAIGHLDKCQSETPGQLDALSLRASGKVPDESRLPLLLAELHAAARQAGIRGVRIATQDPRETAPLKPGKEDGLALRCSGRPCLHVPVLLAGTGAYRQIARLLDSLGHCRRLVTVESVQIRRSRGDSAGLGFELRLDAYYLASATETGQ